jgi:hypothetical protein
MGSLRPIWTAYKNSGRPHPRTRSCGGFMPTAETTLLPAYSATPKRSLTSSAQLDNEPNVRRETGKE